jgi:hypothetical protein
MVDVDDDYSKGVLLIASFVVLQATTQSNEEKILFQRRGRRNPEIIILTLQLII